MTAHMNGQAPPGWGTRPADAKLCEELLTTDVTPAERRWIELVSKRAAEHGGKLIKNARDKLIALAQAKGILAPALRLPPPALITDGAQFSTRKTPGTATAEALIAKYVPSLGGTMPKPPPLPRRRGPEEP